MIKQLHNWMIRIPSYAFDDISVWDDILTARGLFLDIYKLKFSNEFKESIR